MCKYCYRTVYIHNTNIRKTKEKKNLNSSFDNADINFTANQIAIIKEDNHVEYELHTLTPLQFHFHNKNFI